MGQAKKRGNFEERKAQSIARVAEAEEEARRAAEEWFNSLSEEEQAAELKVLRERRRRQAKAGLMLSAISNLAFPMGWKF